MSSSEWESYVKYSEDGSKRWGKILTLLGLRGFNGEDGIREVYTTASAFLAWRELETRSGRIVPHLPDLLEGCDFHWEYEARDTRFEPLEAVRQLMLATEIETKEELAMGQAILEDTSRPHNPSPLPVENATHGSLGDVLVANTTDTTSTNLPSKSPSQQPTAQPSLSPSQRPSGLPSSAPSNFASEPPPPDPAVTPPDVTASPQANTDEEPTHTRPPRRTDPPRTLPPRDSDRPLTEEQYMYWDMDRGNSGANNNNKEQSTRFLQRFLANNETKVSTSGSPFTFLHPFAMVGAFSSRVSSYVGSLGNALEIPQVSGSATSADLDVLPLFARTVPKDDAMAEAFVHYMQSLNVTHVANVYARDSYGTRFHQSLQKYSDASGVRLVGIPYNPGHESSVVNLLKDSQMRYVFATIVEWRDLIRVAYEGGVLGVPGYAWFLSEKFSLLSAHIDKATDSTGSVAHGLSGIGLVNVHGEPREELAVALMEFANFHHGNHTSMNQNTSHLTNNYTALQQQFIDSHAHPEEFEGYVFPPYAATLNQYLYFDAVITLGLAACRTPGLFSGRELYEQLVTLDFEGVTGNVSFDSYGNRNFEGVQYRIDNLWLSEDRSDALHYHFDSRMTSIVAGSNVTHIAPFQFPNGVNQLTTTVPASLPPVEHDYNYLQPWARGLSFFLGSAVMVFCLVLTAWTWQKRNVFVIKAAQPPFLMQLCLGCLIMTSAVFPASFAPGGEDENTNRFKYNAACNVVVWLLCLGFVTAFSAILAKCWRLNKLINSGKAIRRIQVNAGDVLRPFFTLLTINVCMLLGVMFVAPFEFQRIQLNDQDAFGRSVASYGTCGASSNLIWMFLVPIMMANTAGVLMAAVQCYKARGLPLDFSETHYLTISMASLMETVVLSTPVLFALRTEPTSFYVFASVAVSFFSLSILVPVFLPKWWLRNQKAQNGRTQANLIAGNRSRTSSNPNATSRFTNPQASQFIGTQRNVSQFNEDYLTASQRDALGLDLDCDSDAQSSRSSGSSYGVLRIHRRDEKDAKSSKAKSTYF
ncbi:Gamma-aminobutyric acid (GABA) B receptor [Seminavis robusta]|uniref:Gamma-aminobutyric acid (GABA) B receptor n=1 Tax=Seminavis robusta TaxID=568900 RepID=A0A9N8EKA9_9STRA|nr:Gamma-aminobutyric acid (GABA) B receptor [Seminavis robusta]|eukprot:Sro1124_g243790.1 Gamma-aminobutyric acid (GABA) B receptor (1038) ;mRNA; r:11921-15034